ncbi:MAG TPA: 50S ribosomal protein L25 [Chitinophagaceae bacterium]|nr:50S ribosomal protein L25 [Chitinophagaceae bacterium]
MKTITIEGQLRTETGKKATRQLRSQEQVPAVIYGGAKEISFFAPATAFKNLVYTPAFQLAEIKVDGQSFTCIMKDLQFDKVSDQLNHVDFLQLVEGRPVVATIPIKFKGIPVGVKEGGQLITKIKALKVKTEPKYLMENIEVDLSDLELHGNIRVEDVLLDNYEILNSPRIPIASVVTTRILRQEESVDKPAAAAGAPGAAAPAAATAAAPAAAPAKAAPEKGKK